MVKSFFTIVCFFCSLLGLTLIYFSALKIQPEEVRISEINFEFLGRTVKTGGRIVYVNSHPSGHLFLTISDGKKRLQVPLFSSFIERLSERIEISKLKEGRVITVTGTVSEYRGELQVIPRKLEDLEVDSYDF
ncbi:MAG: OB-fold nucleic acid binding domain-containing protein [Candidatus Aenigmatarchaeota archaeon]